VGCANVGAGPDFTCSFGTITSGATVTITVTYTVPSGTTASPQVNSATATSSTTEVNATNNTATDSDTVITKADLQVSKSDGVTSVIAGDGVVHTYTISVYNAGPSDAQAVSLSDTWPAGFSRGTLPVGCANVGAGPDFTCSFGTITSGATVTITVTYTVPSTTDSGDQANTVTATSSTFDPITPNTATDHTTVTESVVLHLTKTFTEHNVTAGTSGHTFTIAVSNSGPSDADHVRVTDTVNARLVVTGISAPGFDCSASSGQTVDCSLLHLDSTDGTLTITVTYTASSGAEVPGVSNTASVTSDEVTTAVTGTDTANVIRRTTTTTVSCSPSMVVMNDVTTCTATVSDSDAGTKTAPSGTVAWTRSGPAGSTGTFGASSCPLTMVPSTTTSSCSVTYTPNSGAGVHTVTGTYSGSTSHFGSSGSAGVTAGLRSTSTTLSCNPVVVPIGTSMTCTATVTDTQASGTKTSPLGTVSFNTDAPLTGTFTPASCTLVAGPSPSSSCSVTYKSTIANVDNLNATYTPNDNVHSGSFTTTSTIVVTYDVTGGFVTGGGYILQPAAGAYPAAIGAGAKNNYGFNAKYKNGASVPTGELEFQFKPGNINLHGMSFDWLVITTMSNGNMKAQGQGSGTNNGTGSFGFLVTTTDGGSHDTFRIRIWDKTTGFVIYDNESGVADSVPPTTVAAGGNIVIHAK
jgi:uncharacterized repeat protein (TIGR01451 family)